MKTNNFILIIILFISGYTAAQEIIVPPKRGARNAAMGDALVSESGDISTVYLNPASLIFLKETSLFINHGQLSNNLGMTENFAVPLLQLNSLILSVGLESYHLGYIGNKTSFPGQNIFEFGYNFSAATNAIAPTFSIGTTVGLQYGRTNHSKTWAASYSLGINYSPSADINYGLALSGLGDYIKYSQTDTVLYAERKTPGKSLVVGASMKYPSASSLRRTVFVLAMASEKIFGRSGLLYKAGFEVIPWKFLNLRFGYVFGPSVSEPRIGLGINYSALVFEYVFFSGPNPVMLQQFSISIRM
ncbi:MAG: hypothetical protein FD122_2213 [Stygiobacter sp.]|nr:MAG: hypothetical protein FD122_2213 [Stygiobacter sp.]KAF0217785.1 MAG: hypothetical protein FD178_319 [Ignavibacteria bacterium]